MHSGLEMQHSDSAAMEVVSSAEFSKLGRICTELFEISQAEFKDLERINGIDDEQKRLGELKQIRSKIEENFQQIVSYESSMSQSDLYQTYEDGIKQIEGYINEISVRMINKIQEEIEKIEGQPTKEIVEEPRESGFDIKWDFWRRNNVNDDLPNNLDSKRDDISEKEEDTEGNISKAESALMGVVEDGIIGMKQGFKSVYNIFKKKDDPAKKEDNATEQGEPEKMEILDKIEGDDKLQTEENLLNEEQAETKGILKASSRHHIAIAGLSTTNHQEEEDVPQIAKAGRVGRHVTLEGSHRNTDSWKLFCCSGE